MCTRVLYYLTSFFVWQYDRPLNVMPSVTFKWQDLATAWKDLFDAVAAGRVLILSPWEHDSSKKHISRADCVALNTMAE